MSIRSNNDFCNCNKHLRRCQIYNFLILKDLTEPECKRMCDHDTMNVQFFQTISYPISISGK
jgi:hypothetical protein